MGGTRSLVADSVVKDTRDPLKSDGIKAEGRAL
jgi:hypothetical protein